MYNVLLRLLPIGLFGAVAWAQAAFPASSDDAAIVATIVQQMQSPTIRSEGAVRAAVAVDGSWIVELGSGWLADVRGPQIPAELDARLQAVRLEVLLQREQAGARPLPLEFRFNGLPLEAWFGDQSPSGSGRRTLATDAGVDVFVSASHGWYLHGGNTWRLQRPSRNGMVEDLVTPQFARRVVDALAQEAVSATLSRSEASSAHPLAAKPWWQMAARYRAQALYPDRHDIWQTYADRGSPLREYNDDIRARPLMANEIAAGALVHLHTNAAADASASGMMAFHQSQRSEDKRLGHVLLCAIREAVQRVPAYRRYPVRVQPHVGNYGENRLAWAPSILIELGFHTNPQDAAALQDPLFQTAVADGLAQGYLQYRRGVGTGGAPVCR